MKNNSQTLMLAGLAVAGYLLLKGNGAPKNDGYPIVYMLYHPDMKLLQAELGVTQDGIFGPKTLEKWKMFWPDVSDIYEIDSYADLQKNIDYIHNIKIASGYLSTGGTMVTYDHAAPVDSKNGVNGLKTLG